LHQESFGGFGARWGKLGHVAGKMRSPAFSVKVVHDAINCRYHHFPQASRRGGRPTDFR